jgi:ATP-binding cassette, subfamily B, bacterial HlyB/CyaB
VRSCSRAPPASWPVGLEAEIERRWEGRLAFAAWTSFRQSHLANLVRVAAALLTNLLMLVILYVGARLVIGGEMSLGALIAGNILAQRAIAPIGAMVSGWHGLQEIRAAFARINGLMNLTDETLKAGTQPATQLIGEIAVENVSFAFAAGTAPVLRNVSLAVASGTILGIVGPSGSGKTTLAKLIQGLYRPSAGRVMIDGTDIAHVSAAGLRQQLGVVPQESQLFSGTVRDNIVLGSPTKDPEQVVAVSRFAPMISSSACPRVTKPCSAIAG